MPRPLTHELLVSVLHTLGAKLTRCTVSDLKDNTYYAILTIEREGKTYSVDARPSDGITLALHEKAAIFVEDSVMNSVAVEEGGIAGLSNEEEPGAQGAPGEEEQASGEPGEE